jgi:uncharacterized protein YxjI
MSFTIPFDKTQEVNILEELNQSPTAVIVHDAGLVVRTGRDVTFDGTLSIDVDGDIVLYEWNFNDGTPIETGPTVRHAFSSRGTYIVALTVYDNWNATGTNNAVIRVIGI